MKDVECKRALGISTHVWEDNGKILAYEFMDCTQFSYIRNQRMNFGEKHANVKVL
jgi:hypothetical protein